jgi:hypothetical protein
MNEWRRDNSRPQRRRPPPDRNNAARQRQDGGGGNAVRNYERYIALAREATLRGDVIEAENCNQYAEHYFRVMRDRTS